MRTLAITLSFPEHFLLGFFILEKQLASQDIFLIRSELSITVYLFLVNCIDLHPYNHYHFSKISRSFCTNRNWGIIIVFLQCNSLTITMVSQKYLDLLQPYSNDRFSKNIKNFLCKWKLENNCSIPSMHSKRQITNLSVKRSFTLYPSLSPYSQTESQMEQQIHLLRMGWRNFFPVVLLCQFLVLA